MHLRNKYKHILQNPIQFFLDNFIISDSNSRNLTDEQMECMQFGICSFVSKPSDEIPYFHF